MSKRYLAVGVSIVLAIALLVWLFKIDPVGTTPSIAPKDIVPMSVDHFSTSQTKAPEKEIPANFVQSVRKPVLNKMNEKEQLIQVFADKIDPKPQGVLDVVKPCARIHLKPNQILEILADRGTFIAPDNQPRSGDFQGKVMIRLFDGPPHRVVDPERSDDVTLVILLNDAHFNLETGQLDSPDDLRLITSKMDFFGKGISLSYNEPEREIARIEVAKGNYLRLAPGVQSRPPASASQPAPSGKSAKSAADPKANRQYRIYFEKDVRISTPEADVQADSLEIFARNPKSSQEQMFNSVSGPGAKSADAKADARAGALTASQRTAALTAESLGNLAEVLSGTSTQPASSGQRDDPTLLFTPSPRDSVIKWNGLFVIEPALTGVPDEAKTVDTFVRLIGQDLKVETIRREAVLAGQIDYTVGLGKLALLPRKDGNLWLVSPQMGAVRAARVNYADDTKSATLLGPGMIITPGGPKDAQLLPKPILEAFVAASAATSQPQSKDDGLPPGLTVAWSRQMDLKFVDIPSTPSAAGSAPAAATAATPGLPVMTQELTGGKNLKLSDVAFNGDVEIRHADFSLSTGRLALTFDSRQARDSRLILRMISADSGVKLAAVSNGQPVALAASRLLLELITDDHDRIIPGKLMVKGNVTGSQGPSTLSAGSMDITFVTNPPAKARAAQPAARLFASGTPPIKSVSLAENVVIKTQEKRDAKSSRDPLGAESVEIYSDKVDVEAQRNWVHLTTKSPKLARIVRTDGIITGSDLTLWDEGGLKFLVAKGAGELKYTMQPKTPDAKPVKGAKPDTVTVTWTGAMDYNEKLATALISDDVFIKADLEKEVTQIKADKLKIDLRPRLTSPEKADAPSPVAEKETAKTLLSAGADPGAALALQEFRYAHATGNEQRPVEMQAYKKPGPDGKIPSRLTIRGQDVRFDPSAQTINVKGAGKMLIEDSQQQAKAPEARDATDFERALRLSGGGDTLFVWKGGMTLDARENALTMNEQVQMAHRPTKEGDVVQLDCSQMVARLKKNADGLDGWLKAKGQRPDIDQIVAERNVSVSMKDQRMLTDKLVYNGDKREMILEAFDGRMTQIFNPANPTGLTAQVIKYELANSRLTVIDPGAARFGEQPPEGTK